MKSEYPTGGGFPLPWFLFRECPVLFFGGLNGTAGCYFECLIHVNVILNMQNVQVVPGQAGGGSFQKNKPIRNGHVAS